MSIPIIADVVLRHALRSGYVFEISKETLHDSFYSNVCGDKALSVLNVAMLCTADALLLGNCQ